MVQVAALPDTTVRVEPVLCRVGIISVLSAPQRVQVNFFSPVVIQPAAVTTVPLFQLCSHYPARVAASTAFPSSFLTDAIMSYSSISDDHAEVEKAGMDR